MNIDKARKRIDKQVKKGFNGYPKVSIAYSGKSADVATNVVITFLLEEGAEAQEQAFKCETDARKDETIQSTLVKIIERADAKTVIENEEVTVL
jgi:hypothetical protein